MTESRTPTDAGNAAAMYAAEYHKARQRIERLELALAQAEEVLRSLDESNVGQYWIWPETARSTNLKRIRAVLATIKELRDGK